MFWGALIRFGWYQNVEVASFLRERKLGLHLLFIMQFIGQTCQVLELFFLVLISVFSLLFRNQ